MHEAQAVLEALLHSPLVRPAAVITPPDEERRRLSGAADLAGPAAAAGIPVLREGDVNRPEVVAFVRALDPDLVVAVGWTRLLGQDLLSVPRHGCVGFHASLLPQHRGRAPVNWAILRGETVTGNTMMLLDPGADTGDIVDQRRVSIGPEDTCATVYERVARAGAEMLLAHLPALLTGNAPRRPQDPAAGDVLPRRTPAMGVIDWDRPPRAVHDWVRALSVPYPGAFGLLDGERVMVWRTRPPRREEPEGAPGLVLDVEPGGVRVAARGGSLLVTEMSGRGEPPQPAAAWARRAGLRPGARFAAVPPEVARWVLGHGPRPQEVAW
ncbi:methionyl-tRNA formyltransferase [Streptomyces griseosporeus]|uniref:methionyl-tRNA formyltransferase n=1 Tax=Streptomyces griseosporeus TaxID=1910 RepID=UPI00167F1200|nr:methionyl-tRNA formyltransferase [Streptomyces griseosporeus]GHF42959.1 methionyl-tRNA formyltransferase [Streptomyces griseosporeus]